MTVKRLTKRRTKLENQHAMVVSDLISGVKPADIAKKYAVSRSSVHDFIERHRPKITALELEADREIQTYAIAHKVYRIAQLDSKYHEAAQWLTDQGFSEKTLRYDRDGNVVGETTRFRADALAQLRGLLADAAAEVGDRTARGDVNVTAGVINIIRGGTPLGMSPLPYVELAPVDESVDAEPSP